MFRGMFEDGRYSKLTAMEKKEYKKSVLEYADVQDAIRCARQNSLQEGIEQGIEEGKRQLIRSMFAEGIPIATISKITGLTEEELQELLNA